MDCKFCQTERVTQFNVLTKFGRADLCDECAQQHGIKPKRLGVPPLSNETSPMGVGLESQPQMKGF